MTDGAIKTQRVYQISPAISLRTTSRIYPVGALDIFSCDIFGFRVIGPFPSLLYYISLLFPICCSTRHLGFLLPAPCARILERKTVESVGSNSPMPLSPLSPLSSLSPRFGQFRQICQETHLCTTL